MNLWELYWTVTVAAAVWVGCDARKLGQEGHELWGGAFATGLLVLLFGPIAFPAYIAARSASLRRQGAQAALAANGPGDAGRLE